MDPLSPPDQEMQHPVAPDQLSLPDPLARDRPAHPWGLSQPDQQAQPDLPSHAPDRIARGDAHLDQPHRCP